ncbi:MAG: phosphatidylserine/phosphatidylglycerophosphate/cardiolipin synthase family protein [Verrucomicrobia bacterium]|nr:phosphatidylserine/phosphatidylglycerophosphate/cardiolipin synthase family protein [Verrucomicrobiota bacterium]
MSAANASAFRLLRTGADALAAMLAAIESATASIQLESYIYANDATGREFLRALVMAADRGVRVRVLVDAFGSFELDSAHFLALLGAGGEMKWFNPIGLDRFAFRSHRKLLVCDGRVAFIGGFNISKDYAGDGRTSGWCDLGLRIEGPLVGELAASFGEMFALADFRHERLAPLRKSSAGKMHKGDCCELLLISPNFGRNPLKRALRHDFAAARDLRIVASYFLPPLRMRRALMRAARAGRRVQLILAGKSDVPLSQRASRSLYSRYLRAGIEVWEYQPQILHAKMVIADDAVYLGSSNLDPRSLEFNYELMVRAELPDLAAAARARFDELLADSRRLERKEWKRSRGWLAKLRERLDYFIVAKVDQFVSRRQLRRLR